MRIHKIIAVMSIIMLTGLIVPAEIVYNGGTHSITSDPAQQTGDPVFSLVNGAAVNWDGAGYAQTNTDQQIRGFVLSDSSSLTMNSGSVSVSGSDDTAKAHAQWIWANSGYSGTVTVNGGTYSVNNSGSGSAKFLRLNDPGSYTINLAGGTVNVSNTGSDNSRLVRMKAGTVNVSGGTYNITDDRNSMVVFNQLEDSKARINVSGGTFNLNAGGDIILFQLQRRAGELRISGGQFNANRSMHGVLLGGRVILEGRFEGLSAGVYDGTNWSGGPVSGVLADGSAFNLNTLTIEEDTDGVVEIITAPTPPYFADNGQESPVNVLQHPSVAYHNGVTYVAYQGESEDAYVAAYHHDTGIWAGPVLAGTSFLVDGDGHGKPTICVDDNGYIHVVFGGHGGHSSFGNNTAYSNDPTNRTLGNAGKQTHVRSDAPEDISSWSELENISPFGTYSQLIKMDDGDIYLFYRHGGHKSDWTWQRSTDNGLTFTGEARIMDAIEYGNGEGVEGWYMFFRKGIGDTIVCTYAYHPCPYENHVDERFNVYYMQMDCRDHSLRNAAGLLLGRPLTKSLADAGALAVETEGATTVLNGSVDVSPVGLPWIIYPHGNGRILHVIRWTGSQWTSPVRVAEDIDGWQKGDLIVTSETEADVIVSGQQEGSFGLSWYKTADSGENWQRYRDLFSFDDPVYRKQIAALIKGGHADARFLIGERVGALDSVMRLFLFGDSGFVPRLVSIASQDGYVTESGPNSGTGSDANSTGIWNFGLRAGDGDNDSQIKALVSFDTSVLANDASILAATVCLKRADIYGIDPFEWGGSCLLDMKKGAFNDHKELEPEDFQAPADVLQVAEMSWPAENGDWSYGELNAEGRANINTGGLTQFRVSFSEGSNNNMSRDYIGFYPGDHHVSANHPQLAVVYSRPETPGEIFIRMVDSSNAFFSWSAKTGRVYELQSKADLVQDIHWNAVTSSIPGVEGRLSITTEVDRARSFYKVIETAP